MQCVVIGVDDFKDVICVDHMLLFACPGINFLGSIIVVRATEKCLGTVIVCLYSELPLPLESTVVGLLELSPDFFLLRSLVEHSISLRFECSDHTELCSTLTLVVVLPRVGSEGGRPSVWVTLKAFCMNCCFSLVLSWASVSSLEPHSGEVKIKEDKVMGTGAGVEGMMLEVKRIVRAGRLQQGDSEVVTC